MSIWKTFAVIPPGSNKYWVSVTGGVAGAQPPATGYFPSGEGCSTPKELKQVAGGLSEANTTGKSSTSTLDPGGIAAVATRQTLNYFDLSKKPPAGDE